MSARRKAKRLADQRSAKDIEVGDAARVLAMARELVSVVKSQPEMDRDFQWSAGLVSNVLNVWDTSRVVLRVDHDFGNALLQTDTDVPLGTEWFQRLPFDSVAYTFPEPISLHDGINLCHYYGFIAAGMSSAPMSRNDPRARPIENRLEASHAPVWSTYGPMSGAKTAVRAIWLYHNDGDPWPRVQTISVPIDKAHSDMTLAEFIDAMQMTTGGYAQKDAGREELPTLVPLTVQLLLYTSATQPDLEDLPPERLIRPQQLTGARVANLGWRVGSVLRAHRASVATMPAEDQRGGWRLPPHIRRARWQRYRFVFRDEQGNATGSRTGVKDVDWFYQWKWLAPTEVNVADRPDPTVRGMA